MADQSQVNTTAVWFRKVAEPFLHFLPVLSVLIIGVAASAALFFAADRWERLENQAEFDYAAIHPVEAVRRSAERIELIHEAIREYYYGDPNVTREEFALSVQPFRDHVPSVKIWQWAPRVSHADRTAFEQAAQREGFDQFQFTRLGTDGRMVRSEVSEEYFPIWYAIGEAVKKNLLGWDIASDPRIRSAMDYACNANTFAITGRVDVPVDVGSGPVILTLLPVYHQRTLVKTKEDRRRELAGFLVGTCLAGKMLDNALRYDSSPRGIDIRVFDDSAPSGQNFLHLHVSRTRPQDSSPSLPSVEAQPHGISYKGSVAFGLRRWSLLCTPAPSFFAGRTGKQAWIALGGGLFLTLLASGFTWAALTRRKRIERIVSERTLQLRMKEDQLRLEQDLKARAARSAHEETIHRLVTASLCRDEETGMHIRRTGLFSEYLALAAGWSEADAEILRLAAPMHDVGKIGIPDAVLRKPGKLTPDEYRVMKMHTLIGAKMLEGSKSAILAMAHDIALSHHERWDGKGYPHGLSGKMIPEAARILSIVDVYDALSHARVYHPAFPEKKVLEIMAEGSGTQFDPNLLELFFAHIDGIRQISEANPDETTPENMVSQSTVALPGAPVGLGAVGIESPSLAGS